MTRFDLFMLLPFIILSAAGVLSLLVIALCRSHRATLATAVVGLVLSLAAVLIVAPSAPRQVTPLLVIDGYALFYSGLILAAALVVVLLSYDYLAVGHERSEEFYVLILLATLGSTTIVAATHFASFFLGLEVLSVSLYALIAYRPNRIGIEAGLKYLVLAAASAAFLLFGMALMYAELGTMQFARLAQLLAARGDYSLVTLIGLVMILVGIGFKLGVVPFHLWTPDVYQGSPAPATAFIATISKGAMFALLLRYYGSLHLERHESLILFFTAIARLSMLVGNLRALMQRNVKRLLAYSSIAHLGYLLVAFLASGPRGTAAATFYLVAYFVTTLGAFGIVAILSGRRDADRWEDYAGLADGHPWLAGALAGMLLSLAGIPLTAGFIGKLYVLQAAVGTDLWLLVIVLIVASTIGLYYYLRLMTTMNQFSSEPVQAPSPLVALRVRSYSPAGAVVLLALAAVLLWLGIYPAPLIRLIHSAVAGLH